MEIQTVSSDARPPVKPRTAAQREASRKNGCKSRGPKTAEGKARSSRNARRHGLSVPAIADPAFCQQVREFALAVAGPSADSTEMALATLVAAAQVDVQRARRAACAVMSGMKWDCSVTDRKALRRLDWIKRYEHRCALCRDKAMRQLRERRLSHSETNPTATRAHPERVRSAGKAHATTGSNNRTYDNRPAGNLAKRTWECSASSDKTNLTEENSAAVRASRVSPRCRHAEARIMKRTRARPPSEWNLMHCGEIRGPRIHSCRTNPRRRARLCLDRRRAVVRRIAGDYRSLAARHRVFRLLH